MMDLDWPTDLISLIEYLPPLPLQSLLLFSLLINLLIYEHPYLCLVFSKYNFISELTYSELSFSMMLFMSIAGFTFSLFLVGLVSLQFWQAQQVPRPS